MDPFESPELLEQEIIEVVLKEEAVKALILYNDDVNTFEFVTESLIKVCGHYCFNLFDLPKIDDVIKEKLKNKLLSLP